MTRLTPTQRTLLEAALTDAEGVVNPAGGRSIRDLIKRGLAISMPLADGGSRLLITAVGREAVAPPLAEPASVPSGKLGKLIELMGRPEGASIAELTVATGWQAHSVRGAISGALKKKQRLTVASEKTQAGRVYRILAEPAA